MKDKIQIYNLKEKKEYLEEVATLEYLEWAENPNQNKIERINCKINKIESSFNIKNFCKLILLKNNRLVGFISIFPHDSDDYIQLTPWYATMYVKKEERGKGFSRILNDAILNKAKEMNISVLYLKTTLDNYYEKFGAIFIEQNKNEKLYKFIL